MKVWNLSDSSLPLADPKNLNTVFTKIGFFNYYGNPGFDNVSILTDPITMDGDRTPGAENWIPSTAQTNNSGGVSLDFGSTTPDGNVQNGIASLGGHESGEIGTEHWYSQTSKPIVFEFAVSNFSEWVLEETGLVIKGQNMYQGESSTLIWGPPNVVPEPGTVILLATGLMGLGGAAWVRRRRVDEV